MGTNSYHATFNFFVDSVMNGIFYQRLKIILGTSAFITSSSISITTFKAIFETCSLDVEIVGEEVEFATKWDGFGGNVFEGDSQELSKTGNHDLGLAAVDWRKIGDGVERIEEEMRLELHFQGVKFGSHELGLQAFLHDLRVAKANDVLPKVGAQDGYKEAVKNIEEERAEDDVVRLPEGDGLGDFSAEIDRRDDIRTKNDECGRVKHESKEVERNAGLPGLHRQRESIDEQNDRQTECGFEPMRPHADLHESEDGPGFTHVGGVGDPLQGVHNTDGGPESEHNNYDPGEMLGRTVFAERGEFEVGVRQLHHLRGSSVSALHGVH